MFIRRVEVSFSSSRPVFPFFFSSFLPFFFSSFLLFFFSSFLFEAASNNTAFTNAAQIVRGSVSLDSVAGTLQWTAIMMEPLLKQQNSVLIAHELQVRLVGLSVDVTTAACAMPLQFLHLNAQPGIRIAQSPKFPNQILSSGLTPVSTPFFVHISLSACDRVPFLTSSSLTSNCITNPASVCHAL